MRKEPIRVRTSERRDWMQCPQKWHWGYVENLKPRAPGPALAFGDLIHQALAAAYTKGWKGAQVPAEAFDKIWADNDQIIHGIWDSDGDFTDAYELGMEMLINYEPRWQQDHKAFSVVAPEQPFQVVLFDSETEDELCVYVGQLDAVVRDKKSGKLGFMEHKTTAGLPPRQFLPMDEQAGSYWAFAPEWLHAWGHLQPDEDMDFILYNFLRKGKKDTRPQNANGEYLNKDGSVSKVQPSPLFYRELVFRNPEARANLRTRVEWQVTMMNWMREGKLPVTKNPDEHCKWCPFRDMCELHENMGDWEAFRDAMFYKWQPYEAHLDIVAEEER